MDRVLAKRAVLFLTIALVGLAVDWTSKGWMFHRLGMPYEGGLIEIWPRVLTLETHLNEGALFGMAQGKVPIFVAMSIFAASFISFWLFARGAARDLWLTIALAGVTGGILGNMVDRLGLPGLRWNYPVERVGQPVHAVRDWIHFQIPGLLDWPVFNVADSLLVCGALMLIWQSFFQQNPQRIDGPGSATDRQATDRQATASASHARDAAATRPSSTSPSPR